VTKSVKQQLKLKKKVLSPKQVSQHNFKTGQKGEDRATIFLKRKGYEILAKNIRAKTKEVDIIALDKKTDELVFIEVKTRKTSFYGHPSLAVKKHKLQNMQLVARAFLQKQNLKKDYRFDIISILPGKIEHFENITWNY
jgi:putative endonuclease